MAWWVSPLRGSVRSSDPVRIRGCLRLLVLFALCCLVGTCFQPGFLLPVCFASGAWVVVPLFGLARYGLLACLGVLPPGFVPLGWYLPSPVAWALFGLGCSLCAFGSLCPASVGDCVFSWLNSQFYRGSFPAFSCYVADGFLWLFLLF